MPVTKTKLKEYVDEVMGIRSFLRLIGLPENARKIRVTAEVDERPLGGVIYEVTAERLLPAFKEEIDMDDWRTSYYRKHKACPKCGGTNLEKTTVGYAQPPDTNRAICTDCKWRGTVDDLVSKGEK